MNDKLNLIALFCFLAILFLGCEASNVTPYWNESENRFYTKDLARAQEEIPFTIILPTYLSQINPEKCLPEIEGPLRQFQDDNNIEVIIRYALNLDNTLGALIIYESNFTSSPKGQELKQELELNPHLEKTLIAGMLVVKTRDDFGAGFDAYYDFNSKEIYYTVETHSLPNKETKKIVESMIKQIK